MLKKTIKIILGIIIALLCTLFVLTFHYGNLAHYLLFLSIQNRNPTTLTVDQKVILFHRYIEAKQLGKALKLGSYFEHDIKNLSKSERVYIAGNLGLIMRATGGVNHELELYEDFFKTDYPILYHAFRAAVFKYNNDMTTASHELEIARSMAREENDSITLSVINDVRVS